MKNKPNKKVISLIKSPKLNNGNIKEDKLKECLFKGIPEYKPLEDELLKIIKNDKNIDLNPKKIVVKNITQQDNIKNNNTWDCSLDEDDNSIPLSIKTNNNKTTKHVQHKSLIKKVFADSEEKRTLWLTKFTNSTEKGVKDFLLKENPNAKYLVHVRKDEFNRTIKRIDRELAKRYQNFFFEMFRSGLTKQETENFLRFSFSSKEYLKVFWNKKNFIIHNYFVLEDLVKLKLLNISLNESNYNVILTFEDDLVLVLRFKISNYKKSLISGSVKGEVNIKSKPSWVKETKVSR